MAFPTPAPEPPIPPPPPAAMLKASVPACASPSICMASERSSAGDGGSSGVGSSTGVGSGSGSGSTASSGSGSGSGSGVSSGGGGGGSGMIISCFATWRRTPAVSLAHSQTNQLSTASPSSAAATHANRGIGVDRRRPDGPGRGPCPPVFLRRFHLGDSVGISARVRAVSSWACR